MKTIVVMPVKNEKENLNITLPIIDKYSDIVIVANNGSSDSTVDILNKYRKVEYFDYESNYHTNKIRWELLKAAREYNGRNLIIAIDADEFIPVNSVDKLKKESVKLNYGTTIYLKWTQLWKDVNKYKSGPIWNPWKALAFKDDKKINYENKVVMNDHSKRVPVGNKKKKITKVPLIHIQWLYYKHALLKQYWYSCIEHVTNNLSIDDINWKYIYSKKLTIGRERLLEKEYISDLNPENIEKNFYVKNDWRFKEINDLFETYGIENFEKLAIWDLEELKNLFIQKVGRLPNSSSGSRYIHRMIKTNLSYLLKAQ